MKHSSTSTGPLSSPADLRPSTIGQNKPDAMQHEPCRLLSYADVPRQLIATYAILAIRNEPDCDQPLIQLDCGFFKDSSYLDRKLLAALGALPPLRSIQPVVFLRLAMGTHGPCHRGQRIAATVWMQTCSSAKCRIASERDLIASMTHLRGQIIYIDWVSQVYL